MSVGHDAAAIIPVRLDSQRLPGKAMLCETGRPLFLHTWDRAIEAKSFQRVFVATDSDEVEAAATEAGAEIIRTSATPRTGSERCAEAAVEIPESFGYFVDIQGDWPEVEPDDLDRLVACLRDGARMATLAVPLEDEARATDPNVVKVVRGIDGNAMYFSRSLIPHGDDTNYPRSRHIGVYAFDRESLLAIPALPSSGLAETERLEQLRFLENGFPMQVLDATGAPWGIESRPDYDAFIARQPRTHRS